MAVVREAVSISLDPATRETLDELARRLGLTRSATIRLLARTFVAEGLRIPPPTPGDAGKQKSPAARERRGATS